MNLFSILKKLHKWFAVIVGAQLLVWVVSGLVFSLINHKEVKGNFIFKNQQKDSLSQSADFSQVLTLFPEASTVSLIRVHHRSAFKLAMKDQVKLVDATTFQEIEISESLIKKIATESYAGGGELIALTKVSSRNDENRGMELPVWQLIYNDETSSTLYFSAITGEFQGVRTDSWRVFDFFMMLHFMDFTERGNFNNSLIIFFASLLVLFSLSGMLLISSSFSLADFTQLLHRFVDHRSVKLTIQDQRGQLLKLKVTKDSTLLDTLFEQKIPIDSDCGGGGICGTCRVRIVNLTDQDRKELSEHEALTDKELAQGYRLSCQLVLERNLKIELGDGISAEKANKV
jgi:Na+-transporting NADH:ubiquinone oxidoreductase subunit F